MGDFVVCYSQRELEFVPAVDVLARSKAAVDWIKSVPTFWTRDTQERRMEKIERALYNTKPAFRHNEKKETKKVGLMAFPYTSVAHVHSPTQENQTRI